jgi:cysteine desulfurase
MEIYFDNSATTRISEEALAKYVEVSRGTYGNPSSLHKMGLDAEKLLRATRDQVLKSLGAKDGSVIFTASGSEANNLAIIGRAKAKSRFAGKKIITTDGEHASVSEPLAHLAAEGFRVVKIATVGGRLDMEQLARELTPDVILITMMMVNNETGALYDTAKVSAMAKRVCPDALIHLDATQSYMKIPFTKSSVGADMITISSHKIEGPKGVGALVVDNAVIKNKGLAAMILGGGQEGGLRSGTENVPGICAFGEAIRIASEGLRARYSMLCELRERLLEGLEGLDVSVTVPERYAPHIVNVTLPCIKSETMLHYLSSFGIFVSSGSACSSNSGHVSSALVAFGRSAEEADSSIRISLSYKNTAEEIDLLIDGLKNGIEKLARIRR